MYKILLAEDEEALGVALSSKLKSEGYGITLVNDGAKAIDELEKNHFDLAMIDLIMPSVDGFKVLEAMNAKTEKPPIIVFSNLAQDADRDRAIQLGAAAFYIKSNTSLAEILSIVKKYLVPVEPNPNIANAQEPIPENTPTTP